MIERRPGTARRAAIPAGANIVLSVLDEHFDQQAGTDGNPESADTGRKNGLHMALICYCDDFVVMVPVNDAMPISREEVQTFCNTGVTPVIGEDPRGPHR
jgi:hypothetical protein